MLKNITTEMALDSVGSASGSALVTKEEVVSESQYCDKHCPTLELRFTTLAANCLDSHYLTSKSP